MAEVVGVPGPADRESFFDAQRRNRRASWWFTVVSALTILLVGVPLSAVVSPLLYALAVVVLDLVNLLVPTPDLLAALAASDSTGPLSVQGYVVVGLALVLPGAIALLLAWLGVRRVFRRAGAGATVLALGARPPRSDDLAEVQVVNVVQELAIAAGVPSPAVAVLPAAEPNAAAVGSSLGDCTVVVTTGLLATLDREETQGVLASVVASVGNGDLRIGLTIASVFQTIGFVSAVVRAPADKASRRLLWRLVRAGLRRPGADNAAAAAELLTRAGADPEVSSEDMPKNGFTSMLALPFVMAGAAFDGTATLWGAFLVNPFLRRAWRARRYLADAAAVQLTRNPDGVARGLGKVGALPAGAEWTAHLFAGGDPAAEGGKGMRSFQPKPAQRLERLRAMGASSVAPRLAQPRSHRLVLAVFALVTSPCWLTLGALVLALPLLLALIALMVDSLFLAPMVGVIHALLR